MMLERHNPKPLYQQLTEILRKKIEGKEWGPNEVIPSENVLSGEYGVSRMTARAVVSQFVREGLLYRVPGKGTFVAEPKITTANLTYMGIREQLERLGYQTTTKVLDVDIVPCPIRIQSVLNLDADSAVYAVRRLRSLKDSPLSIHISYIPATLCPNLENQDLVGEQLCIILDQKYGLTRKKVTETLESCVAGSEAKLLEVKRGYPLLLLKDVISTADDVPFEYTEVFFRGDKIKIEFQYVT